MKQNNNKKFANITTVHNTKFLQNMQKLQIIVTFSLSEADIWDERKQGWNYPL